MERFKTISLACLAVAAVLAVQHDACAETPKTAPAVPSVVAVVNADPITSDQLAEETLRRYGVDMLDNMINRHLILQACTARQIEVTNGDVSAEIHRIAAKFGLTTESYLQLLQEERDIAPDQYGREVIWPMLALRRLVADRVEVTEEEFNRAFLARYGEAMKCRMIMVSDRQLAQSLRDRAVAAPGDFGTLAKQHSQDEGSASVRGLIPPIRRYSGDSRLEEAAFALAENEISEVLQLGDQWIVLQAVRRLPASSPNAQAMPALRDQITDSIRDEKMKETATELFAQLQKEAQVVKVLGDEQASQQYPGVAAVVNGQKVTIAQVAAESVKRHGNVVLEGEINRKLLTQALSKAGKTVTQADLDAEVARAAKSYGYVRADGQPDVAAWLEAVVADGAVNADVYVRDSVWPSVALGKLTEGQVSVTEDDLKEGFESNYGPRVEVLAIVLSDQRSAQKIWEMARSNPTEEFFGSLAEQYSVEPVSQSNFGKVPPIRKFGGQPAIEKEAFALKPGELSGIIATGDKYIILRCQGLTDPVVKDYAAVREELMASIQERKSRLAMAKKFDELKETAQIDNFLEVVKKASKVAAAPKSPAPNPTTR
ncbi:MAG: peptidylprolyl isomerase [Planctomycetaceae bacterium]